MQSSEGLLHWGWRIHLLGGSLTCLNKLLLAVGRRSSPNEPFSGLLECPLNMEVASPWVRVQERSRLKLQYFLRPSLKKSHSILSSIDCWLHRSALFNMGGNYKKVWISKGKITEGPSLRPAATWGNVKSCTSFFVQSNLPLRSLPISSQLSSSSTSSERVKDN